MNTTFPIGVQDSAEIFAQDTARSARDLAHPDLIKVLTGNSASVVEWLQEKFKLDLSLVSRLGGHSQPRTHRRKEMFPVPDAKIKFLAAEALWGVGGLLLNGEGKRFCDELGHRDYVTGEIWKTKVPVRLVLNSKPLCWSWFDENFWILLARKFFHNVPITINDQFHVALMSLYYGGIDINAESDVRDMQEQVIPGLFASGEIAGDLGGSSLLGCVVYGRVAGDSASRYLFQNLSSATANCRLGQIARQLAPYQTIVSVDPTNQKMLQAIYSSIQAPQASPSQAPAPEKKADAPTREKKEYTAEEVAKSSWRKTAIIIYAGKDATEEVKKFSFDLFDLNAY
ncbi:hypothetical protein C2G38_2210175 [Gigaspora rosea]|uniref:FAD-dependent oxidoreductase 2 FAD-binding domain-containing protein n=1 Tax=Gigaspora rosea TaxID=44941 RepID=A0A397UPB5_9GLOM|nr:hypothetical protein C2G38_2210175 [Gigaspora rosea]